MFFLDDLFSTIPELQNEKLSLKIRKMREE